MNLQHFVSYLIIGLAIIFILPVFNLPVQAEPAPVIGCANSYCTFMPFILQPNPQGLIINHQNTDITRIPDYWIQQAKTLVFHYAHTSHGSQIISGLDYLQRKNPKYAFHLHEGSNLTLPTESGMLKIYDGNNPDTYITPELYWSTEAGMQKTRSVVNKGWFNFSMWSWCGQQSTNSVDTVNQYLSALHQLEMESPNTRFILMTGHTDGTGFGGTLFRNNDLLRTYAQENDKILFDFADIESYDPEGNFYLNNGDGNCTWCAAYCSSHPSVCADLDQIYSCAHTDAVREQKLFCKLKGQAFWWMLARLAGWDGVSS